MAEAYQIGTGTLLSDRILMVEVGRDPGEGLARCSTSVTQVTQTEISQSLTMMVLNTLPETEREDRVLGHTAYPRREKPRTGDNITASSVSTSAVFVMT